MFAWTRCCSLVVVLATTAAGCTPRPPPPAHGMCRRSPAARPPFCLKASGRVVAIGDLHGDLLATGRALRLAGAIDAAGAWIGGNLTIVQTGDRIDRGDSDREVLDLLDRLQREAMRVGGALYALVGNHEVMNVASRFDDVSPRAWRAFASVPGIAEAEGPSLTDLPSRRRPRAAAFLPGGPYARRLAEGRIIIVVNDTIFVHGGVLPWHLDYGLARLNNEQRAWMLGQADGPPAVLESVRGPLWNRRYSRGAVDPDDCARLTQTLKRIGVQRMVVGHTVQEAGINSVCGGRLWRIDVGLSARFGGPTQVLEIQAETVRVLAARR